MTIPRPLRLTDAFQRLGPGSMRRLHGISAVLLPYTREGAIDWKAFEAHLARTRSAGLDVAVNMDTGFGDLLTASERDAVLDATRRTLGPGVPFYAGAFALASPDPAGAYRESLRSIQRQEGIPVVVQCPAMHGMPSRDKVAFYQRLLDGVECALAFELGPVFAAHGEIWDDETFERILGLRKLVGVKHSSLDRATELRRLAARDRVRPDFRIYTGNDLAIDMVAYGSDYLLGLSTFDPHAFASRDRALEAGDPEFLPRNDCLQHLGNVAFRTPVPAYKHAAALYLHLVGALETAEIHPRAPRRPQSDRILLLDCARRLGALQDPEQVYRERVAPFLS